MTISEKTSTTNTTAASTTRLIPSASTTEILNTLAHAESCLQQLAETPEALVHISQKKILEELHPDTAFLNRTYLREVQARSLKVVPEILDWRGYRVRVFLRHDSQFVFAIAFRSWIGMANHVILRNAQFEVDVAGRQQTLDRRGPLPNGTTVHAWISGTLDVVENEAGELSDEMEPVFYKPAETSCFCRASCRSPLQQAIVVQCVPGPLKVWVPKQSRNPMGDRT